MNENEERKEVLPASSSLDEKIQSLADQIVQEQDADKTKDLISLFNWNMSKKNVSRVQKLNALYDAVTDQMTTRFANRADQFTNADLLDYMKTIQGAIDTSSKNLSEVEEPPRIVQQNNTQINVNVGDSFDREAKQRILEAVQATLKLAQQKTIELPQEDINPVETEVTPCENDTKGNV